VSHNPEKREWRGRSYRKGGERVTELRDKTSIADRHIAGDEDPMKPTPAQIAALRLAARDAIRYYRGGWYSVPAMYGPRQDAPRVTVECAQTGTEASNISASPATLRACAARGWLDAITLPKPPALTVYDRRWTLTPAGRAVIEAAL
jgi:hypothetical protein